MRRIREKRGNQNKPIRKLFLKTQTLERPNMSDGNKLERAGDRLAGSAHLLTKLLRDTPDPSLDQYLPAVRHFALQTDAYLLTLLEETGVDVHMRLAFDIDPLQVITDSEGCSLILPASTLASHLRAHKDQAWVVKLLLDLVRERSAISTEVDRQIRDLRIRWVI